jgi:polysaccharide biosynthesis/export protein
MSYESFHSWLWFFLLFLISLFPCGCAHHHCAETRKALMRETPLNPEANVARPYQVGCPDVLRVDCPERPEVGGLLAVEANGCIALASLGGLRVEGLTVADAKDQLAEVLQVPAGDVQLEVAEYRRQHVYLFGEVSGLQHAIPYRGSESVADLIRRAGGVTKEGAPDQVRVIRNSQVPGGAPRVFVVDLQAILLRGDNRTNLLVEPNDQIYVPESKQARFSKCFHPWFKAVAEWLEARF